MKRIIWTSEINIEDWKNDYMEENSLEKDSTVPDDSEIFSWAEELNGEYLEDERVNLNKFVNGAILVIADIGRWNGRFKGYKILSNNIKDILFSDSENCEWFSDGYNIRSIEHHHDGTNYLLFREIRNDRNIDNLLDKIYKGEEISSKTLNYYTKSLYSKVKTIYGW